MAGRGMNRMLQYITVMFLVTLAGCADKAGFTEIHYLKEVGVAGPGSERTEAKALLGKEMTAKEFFAEFNLAEGTAKVEADEIETKSVQAIQADAVRIHAKTEGARSIINGLGEAGGGLAGEAARHFIGLP